MTTGSVCDYCFTLFIDDEWVDSYSLPEEHFSVSHDNFKYIIYQIEQCPTTRRYHVQGFIKCSRKTGIAKLKSEHPILDSAHLERRKGTVLEAINYCRKEDSRIAGPYSYGTEPTGQGQRSDRDSYIERITKLAKEGKSWDQAKRILAEEAPGAHFIFKKQAISFWPDIQPREQAVISEFRPWQRDLDAITQVPPNNRTIHWVFDPEGGAGKSTLLKHWLSSDRATTLTGKLVDMAYAWAQSPKEIAVFDMPRAQNLEHIDHIYQIAETLKNGFIFSPKYESRCCTFKVPHVIIFSNGQPDRTKWSSDRLNLIDLS